jgi:hypothetical protein
MKLPYECPAEIWLQVMTLLCTRDLIFLSRTCKHLHAMAEEVRKRRQDIQLLLSMFVGDIEGFRRLMQKTGAIIVGETATAFFTGASRGELRCLDLVLNNVDLESCANSWFSFLKGETIDCPRRIPTWSPVDQKVCSLRDRSPQIMKMLRLIH